MTAPRHHPSQETLAAYVAGTLRAGFDLVVAVHVRGCAHCRAEVALLEACGGSVLAEGEPAAIAPQTVDAVLKRLGQPAVEPAARSIDSLLSSARRRWVAPGVWVAKVDTPHDPNDRVYILSAAPRVATALHTHEGLEFTQVLKGALDDNGEIYRAGDFTMHAEQHTHRPTATGDESCVCLFATQGRLSSKGVIGRIAFALADV